LKDVPILGGALAAQAKYLLTGDEKGFGQFFRQDKLTAC